MSPILTKTGHPPTFRELRSQAAVTLQEESTKRDQQQDYEESADQKAEKSSRATSDSDEIPPDVGWRGSSESSTDDLIYSGPSISTPVSPRPLSYARREYTEDEDQIRQSPTGPTSKWIDLRNLLLAVGQTMKALLMTVYTFTSSWIGWISVYWRALGASREMEGLPFGR